MAQPLKFGLKLNLFTAQAQDKWSISATISQENNNRLAQFIQNNNITLYSLPEKSPASLANNTI